MQALLNAIAQLPLPADAGRYFHGRGGLHAGCEHLTLDAYPPAWVLTSFKPLSDEALSDIGAALQARWMNIAPGQPLCWVYQCLQPGQADTRLMTGTLPSPHTVTERGTRYAVHLLTGQNHGLFLDMAEGRRWVFDHMQHLASTGHRPKVLNLFAYTCAFSVVALQGGARHVLNVDMSRGALGTGQHNHALNGLTSGASFMAHDIFNTWGKVTRGGPYDLVIADPPSYQKGSFVATKDYARLVRRLPELLAPGGHALLCLNAPELGTDFLLGLLAQEAPDLQVVQRLANPAAFADTDPERALKVMVCRAPALDTDDRTAPGQPPPDSGH
ncbi:MAG TPA: class I SAM-dependent methyltransferase [Burkholderiaceae bacterium]|nr:class I SAM-dependent methyltransferase [Burkholderiaceae bacterium]